MTYRVRNCPFHTLYREMIEYFPDEIVQFSGPAMLMSFRVLDMALECGTQDVKKVSYICPFYRFLGIHTQKLQVYGFFHILIYVGKMYYKRLIIQTNTAQIPAIHVGQVSSMYKLL